MDADDETKAKSVLGPDGDDDDEDDETKANCGGSKKTCLLGIGRPDIDDENEYSSYKGK